MPSMPGAEHAEYEPSKAALGAGGSLMLHIAEKGVQAGGILGLLRVAVSAGLHMRRGNGLDAAFLPRAQSLMFRTGVWTTGLTCLAGLGVLGLKEGWDKEKLEDRAYRLHYNEPQNRCDRFSEVGAAAGSLGALLAGARSVHGVAAGLLLGAASGTILHGLTSASAGASQLKSATDSAQKVAGELSR